MKRLAIVLIMVVMVACETTSSEIGTDFFTDGALDFSYTDSSTVKLSTVQYERMATSSTGRILLGSYEDEKLGVVAASAFIRLAPSETVDLQDQDVTYES